MTSSDFERRRIAIRYPRDVVMSAAQNLEDVLLNRVFEGKRQGFYVDIGAGDPNFDSVTRWFYSIGWRGCNVEPNPRFMAAYEHYRPEDVNLFVGVARESNVQTYFRVDRSSAVADGWGLSTFDPTTAERARDDGFSVTEFDVPTLPLRDIAASYLAGRAVDFLKIDVEGFEKVVLESADWTSFRPAVIMVEATAPSSVIPSHEEWETILLAAGYTYALFDGLNAYYVAAEAASTLLSQFNAGVNVFDVFRHLETSCF